jgi:type VI secretion system protein VasI
MPKLLIGMVFVGVLVACGVAPTASTPPTPIVVTQVVTQIVRETVVVTATPPPATATPKASPTPQATTTPTPNPIGKWEQHQGTSSFDDSTTATILLEAEDDITGPLAQAVRPALIIRCQEKQLEAYVNTGMQPDVESGNFDGATVRLRIDQKEPQTLNMGKSTDGEALFFPDVTAIVKQLLAAERMAFEFTPFSANPAEMIFDVRGIQEAIKPVRAACAQTP